MPTQVSQAINRIGPFAANETAPEGYGWEKIGQVTWQAPFLEIYARDILNIVLENATIRAIQADSRDTLELVLAEIFNNILEHAALGQEQIDVTLMAQSHNGHIFLRIQDSGSPMPGLQLPLGQLLELDGERASLPEGGFGWFLIKTLVENLCYQRCKYLNTLYFSLPISAT